MVSKYIEKIPKFMKLGEFGDNYLISNHNIKPMIFEVCHILLMKIQMPPNSLIQYRNSLEIFRLFPI